MSVNHKTDLWLPLFIGDYLSDTMHLTTEQHGAYLLLIMAYWKKRGPISADPHYLAGIARMNMDGWGIAQAVLKEFFDTEAIPGKWVHHRVEKELSRAIENQKTARKKGLAGAKARWGSGNNGGTNG